MAIQASIGVAAVRAGGHERLGCSGGREGTRSALVCLGGGGGMHEWTGTPEELDQSLFEILAERDDAVDGFGPDDHDAFVSL
jgi:hypothetical protein